MPVNFDYQKQSFGALKINKNTKELISNRIKIDADLKELDNLISSQMNNKFDVCIFNRKDSKYLSGYVNTKNGKREICEESDMGGYFSPLNFIKSLCRQADYQNQSSKISKNFNFLK